MKSFGRFTGFFLSPKITEQLHHRYIYDARQVFCIAPIRSLGFGLNSLTDRAFKRSMPYVVGNTS
jgi:hypothetical protein